MDTTFTIHPSSIIEGEVKIAHGVKIGPFSHIIGPVQIGENTSIGSHCYIQGPVEIGERNRIFPHCVFGTDSEHKTAGSSGVIRIGDDNTIRELTVIQRGTGDRDTEIKDFCYIMDHAHIAHDVLLDNEVTISPNVVLGGHTVVLHNATIGIGVVTHQFSTIGAYAMIGMGSVVTKDAPPFSLVFGSPAKFKKYNEAQISKLGITDLMESEIFKLDNDIFIEYSRRDVLSLD
jgi:UDP-N-acetylglucosamine acyltransferase